MSLPLWTRAARMAQCSMLALTVLLVCPHESLTQEVALEHLSLHMSFDNNSVIDLSTNGHRVTNHNGIFGVGVEGGGLLLNGVDAYLEVAHAVSLEIPDALTSSFWYKHEAQSTSAFYSLIEQSADEFGGHSRYGTWIFDGNKIQSCVEPDQCTNGAQLCQRCITASDRLEEGMWYHIASTYDGSVFRMMINGEVSASMSYASATGISVRTYPLTIGADPYDSNPVFLKGTLDDVRLYDTALSESEISTLYEAFLVSTSTEDLIDREITVYPSPVGEVLHISSYDDEDILSIVDMSGRIVRDNLKVKRGAIDVSDLNSGVYLLIATRDRNIITRTSFVRS